MKPPRSRQPQGEGDHLGAREALASILRLWGRYAFDCLAGKADVIAQKCEQWASHLLTGLPADPLHPERNDGRARHSKYAELSAFVEQLRRAEKLRVEDAIQAGRNFITQVSSLLKALRDEQAVDLETLNAIWEQRERDREASDPAKDQTESGSQTREAWIGQIESIRKHQEILLSKLSLLLADFQVQYVNAYAQEDIDMLTSLLTRTAFDQALKGALEEAEDGGSLCFLIDLDHFGELNDRFGHTAGDEVLRQVAALLRRLFPYKDGVVARFDGEAFAVLLRDMDLQQGEQLAYQVLDEIRQLRVIWEGDSIALTCSVSYAKAFERESMSAFLSRLHCALLSAKRHRNCAVAG